MTERRASSLDSDNLRTELRDMLRRRTIRYADINLDASSSDAENHRYMLALLDLTAYASVLVNELADEAAWTAAAYGSSYDDIAEAAHLSSRNVAARRHPRIREAMRSRRWIGRNRAEWLSALRILLALRDRVHGGDEILRGRWLDEIARDLPTRDDAVSTKTLIDALIAVSALITDDVTSAEDETANAVGRVRELIADWAADVHGTSAEDGEA